MAFDPIPNRIVSGNTREFSAHKMITETELGYNMLTKPHLLEAYVRHHTETSGLVSEILTHLGSNSVMDVATGTGYNSKTTDGIDRGIANRLNVINNYEFVWRGQAPKGEVGRFTRDFANAALATRGGAVFEHYGSYHQVSVDDILLLADQRTQVKVLAVTNVNGTTGQGSEYKYTLRLLTGGPNGASSYVAPILLKKNAEFVVNWNQKSATSSHGSKVHLRFGDWYRNWLTTMRMEWNSNGLAMRLGIDESQKKWLVFTDNAGNQYPYWVDAIRYETDKQMMKYLDNMLFFGQKDQNANGEWMKDSDGYDFISGDGIYHQSNKRLQRTYNNVNEALIESMFQTARTDNDGVKPTLLVLGGFDFEIKISKFLRNYFNAAPEVMYWQNQEMTGQSALMNGVQGVKTNFKILSTEMGTFVVGGTNIFDSKSAPKLIGADGKNWNSSRAFVLNVTDNIAGARGPAFEMVTLKDSFYKGKLNGMAAPENGIISTPQDVTGEHTLIRAGIAVHNPNMLMELSKPLPLN